MYIKASGATWTNLHPNYFMESLLGLAPIKGGAFPMYCGTSRVGSVALKDVAAVSAAVLRDGPEKHGGQDYLENRDALKRAASTSTSRQAFAEHPSAWFRIASR